MKPESKSLARRLLRNAQDLERELSRPQVFPHVGDGPRARQVLDKMNLPSSDSFEEYENRRLHHMRRLQKARYEDWLSANAKTAPS